MSARNTRNKSKNPSNVCKINNKDSSVNNKDSSVNSEYLVLTGRSSSVSSTDCLELFEKKILNNINRTLCERFSEFEDLISQKLDLIASQFNAEVSKLRDELDDVKADLAEAQHELENLRRANRSSDAVIKGIPCMQNEDPQQLITNISSAISHSLSPYSTAFRAKSGSGNKNSTGRDAPLIVKFSSPSEQRTFLHKFKNHGALPLNKISSTFTSDNKINAYESLTRCSQLILRRALDSKRRKVIHSVYTRQGNVFVRVAQHDRPILVANLAAFDDIISEASSTGA